MTPIKVIIDTDPGMGEPGSDIDDGLAIVLALRSPELDVLGLTVVNGNVDADVGTDVARRLAQRLGLPQLPVLRGADSPLARDMGPVRSLFERVLPARHASPQASPAQLGPTEATHAVDWMIDKVHEFPGEVVVVAIGPMTNLALAIQKDASFASLAAELVLMAGSATGYAQNVTVVGDFNTFVDPEALQVVLESGANIRMVGLDQTSQVRLTTADVNRLRQGGHAGSDDFTDWIADCAESWITYLHHAFPNRPEHADGCFLHDPLVVAAVIDPPICAWEQAAVATVTDSELARGLVVADRGLALQPRPDCNATVAVSTDVGRFARLFFERITTQQLSGLPSGAPETITTKE